MGICSNHDCTRRSSFNMKGIWPAVYCKQHADDGMIDVRSRRCSHASCTKQPAFNTEGSKRAAYCKAHAGEGMVNVSSRRCSYASCTKISRFNTEGRKRAAYCKTHAGDGMVDVSNRRCSHDSCTKHTAFNFDSMKSAMYCKQHAADGMVIVYKTNHCLHFGCTRRRVWGVPADCAPTVCFHHKDDIADGPVFNFKAKCKFEGCSKESRWRLTGEQPAHCPDHGRPIDGLVCTIVTARGKVFSPGPSYHAARTTSYTVKTECSF